MNVVETAPMEGLFRAPAIFSASYAGWCGAAAVFCQKTRFRTLSEPIV